MLATWGSASQGIRSTQTSYGKTLCAARCSPFFGSSGTNTATIARNWHTSKIPLTKLGVTVGHAKLNTSTAPETQASANAITWEFWVEYPAGVYTQKGTWNSGNTTSSAITFQQIAESDELTLSTPIPANTDFWIWLRATSAGGMYFNSWQNAAKGEVLHTGTSGIETAPSGTIPNSGNFSMPPLVIWTSAAITEPAMVIEGDSKNAGFNDRPVSATAAGYLQTGEIGRSVADGQHYVNISSGGSRAGGGSNDWTTVWVMRKLILKYFSHHFMSLGFNDILVDAQTAATLKTRLQTCTSDILAANSNAKITVQTLGPRSTSTGGGWVSLADQAAANNTQRITHNRDNVRAGAITGNNNGYLEIANLIDADPVDNNANNGKWKMVDAVLRTVTDGVSNATTTITSATANFSAADVGVGVAFSGAGAAGGMYVSWISSVTNSTTAVMFAATATSVPSGGTIVIGTRTPDGLHETAEGYQVPFNNGIPAAILTKLAA